MKAYKHTQIGYSVIIVMLLGIILTLYLFYINNGGIKNIIMLLVLFLMLAIFHKLTIIITEEKIVCFFNFKLFKKSFYYKEIAKVDVVPIPWYHGIGIRFFLKGFMYNVSLKKAIQLNLNSGKIFRLGTDKPAVLLREILHFSKINNVKE